MELFKEFSARYGNREGLDLARLTLTGTSFKVKMDDHHLFR